MANFKRTILTGFFLSNVSAIIYQVVWGRELGYVFGTSMYAVSTVLTAFMAGLALGSYFFGRLADSHKDPVRLFSYLQIATGVYGIAMIGIFKFLPYVYLFLYDIFSWSQQVFMLSLFILAFVFLIIPTTLMGGTFPVIGKIYNDEIKMIGEDIGTVYSADTIGACTGALLGGFVLMPVLGLGRTATFAALLNLLLGIYILKELTGKAMRPDAGEQKREKHGKP